METTSCIWSNLDQKRVFDKVLNSKQLSHKDLFPTRKRTPFNTKQIKKMTPSSLLLSYQDPEISTEKEEEGRYRNRYELDRQRNPRRRVLPRLLPVLRLPVRISPLKHLNNLIISVLYPLNSSQLTWRNHIKNFLLCVAIFTNLLSNIVRLLMLMLIWMWFYLIKDNFRSHSWTLCRIEIAMASSF